MSLFGIGISSEYLRTFYKVLLWFLPQLYVLHGIRKQNIYEIEGWHILDRVVKRQLGPYFSEQTSHGF